MISVNIDTLLPDTIWSVESVNNSIEPATTTWDDVSFSVFAAASAIVNGPSISPSSFSDVADEADHRKIHIRMTGKAKPVLEEFEQIRADILERLFAGVTEEERSCLKRVMGKIMKNIQAEQEDGT